MSADFWSRVSRLGYIQPPFSHPSHTPLTLLPAGDPGDPVDSGDPGDPGDQGDPSDPIDPGDHDDDSVPAVKVEGCQAARRRN